MITFGTAPPPINGVTWQMTLGDLLDAPGLGLRLVFGDLASRKRMVRGAHAVDLAHPAPWLDRDWVLLTVGSALQGTSPDEHRTYVASLADAGVTAIGLGVGIVLDTVPNCLLDAARDFDVPLFTIAPETPFRSVISFVHGVEHEVLVRRLAAQSRLMSSLNSTFPERALVEHVARLLQRPVHIVDRSGSIFASSGGHKVVPQARVHVIETTGLENPLRMLVPAFPTDDAEVFSVLEMVDEVLGLFGGRAEVINEERRIARAAVLDDMLTQGGRVNELGIERRLYLNGIDLEAGCRIAALEPADPSWQVHDSIVELELLAQAAPIPHLLADQHEYILGLFPAVDGVDRFLESLQTDWIIGIGSLVDNVEAASLSARNAHAALREAKRRTGAGQPGLVRQTDLGFSSWLLALGDPDLLRERAERRLLPLRTQPLLMEAVAAYLTSDLDATKAAQRLFLHPNSMRYRLGRAEVLLGAKLRSPEIIADLHLTFSILGWPTVE